MTTVGEALFSPWTLDPLFPGNVYVDDDSDEPTLLGHFEWHVLAADAVCAHNAVLLVRA